MALELQGGSERTLLARWHRERCSYPQGQVTEVTMGQMEAGPHLISGNLDFIQL